MRRPCQDGVVGCAAIADALGEPRFAKAASNVGWLLIEAPGTWSGEPFPGQLDADVLAELRQCLSGAPVKLLAIRRHGRDAPSTRTVFFGYSGSDGAWLRRLRCDDDRELLDLDVHALTTALQPEYGEHVDEPLYLVCTNGKKDPCCAVRGRPVAKALAETRPAQTWECSHFGGDRFAANMLCLPHGVWYGHVRPDECVWLAQRYEDGELCLKNLRGRAGGSPAAQAAEFFLRRETGLVGLDDLGVARAESAGDCVAVTIDAGQRRHRVVVRQRETGVNRPVTCAAETDTDPGEWELVSAAAH